MLSMLLYGIICYYVSSMLLGVIYVIRCYLCY